MPREYVYGPNAFPTVQPADGEACSNPGSELVVSVGWSREDQGGGVQIATIRNGKEASFDAADGLYIDLDRRSINDLIRKLRRARDQAFGRDE